VATTEMRFSGLGGQGMILCAYVVGRAAAVIDGRHATLNQAFGPEARGSACSAQLVVSDEPVMYPYVRGTDILVAMSQDAYKQFVGEVRDGGTVIVDESLVTPVATDRVRILSAPVTLAAEKLGKRIAGNMVMAGVFTAATGIVSPDAMRQAIRESVPGGTEDLNLAAFERGLEIGRSIAPAGHAVEATR
jgi:2-oxoglutarate ferredoxin oxidoreductase subunit gamma